MDEMRAVHPQIICLLSALTCWSGYRQCSDPRLIADIAIQMVNCLDYDNEIDIKNVLGSPQMVAEIERQRRLLTAAVDT
jgi:hypothetical protein